MSTSVSSTFSALAVTIAACRPADSLNRASIQERVQEIVRLTQGESEIWGRQAQGPKSPLGMRVSPPRCEKAKALKLQEQWHPLSLLEYAVIQGDLVSICLALSGSMASECARDPSPWVDLIELLAAGKSVPSDLMGRTGVDLEALRIPQQCSDAPYDGKWRLFEYALVTQQIKARIAVALIDRQLQQRLSNPRGESFRSLWQMLHQKETEPVGIQEKIQNGSAPEWLGELFPPRTMHVQPLGSELEEVVAGSERWRELFPEWILLEICDYAPLGSPKEIYPAIRGKIERLGPEASALMLAKKMEDAVLYSFAALRLVQSPPPVGWALQAHLPIPQGTWLGTFTGALRFDEDDGKDPAMQEELLTYACGAELELSYGETKWTEEMSVFPKYQGGLLSRAADGLPSLYSISVTEGAFIALANQDLPQGHWITWHYGAASQTKLQGHYQDLHREQVNAVVSELLSMDARSFPMEWWSRKRSAASHLNPQWWTGSLEEHAIATESPRWLKHVTYVVETIQPSIRLFLHNPMMASSAQQTLAASNSPEAPSDQPASILGHPMMHITPQEAEQFEKWLSKGTRRAACLAWVEKCLGTSQEDFVIAATLFCYCSILLPPERSTEISDQLDLLASRVELIANLRSGGARKRPSWPEALRSMDAKKHEIVVDLLTAPLSSSE